LHKLILSTFAVHAQQVAEGSEWTEQELALLAKAVARYPGGVADRWEKISHMVGRSVKEVYAQHCILSFVTLMSFAMFRIIHMSKLYFYD